MELTTVQTATKFHICWYLRRSSICVLHWRWFNHHVSQMAPAAAGVMALFIRLPCIQRPPFYIIWVPRVHSKSNMYGLMFPEGISWWQSSVDMIAHDFTHGEFQYLYNVINQNATPPFPVCLCIPVVCKVSTTRLYPYRWDIFCVN